MEDTECKISKQGVQKDATEEDQSVGIQHQKSDLAIVTPEKTSVSRSSSSNKETNQLPEKYCSILEFFNRMITSLRLLGLHKKTPSFQNICSQVERMTRRKFEYKHLAQIKYILPEAIQINKILVHDTETLCMKPDIKVTLLFDVVEGHSEPSAYISLSNAFASRLTDFISTHPEGQTCDIPEALLPEPFNQMDITVKEDQLPVSTSNENDQVKLSNFGPSFSKCFSVKAIGAESEKTRPFARPLACSFSKSDCVTDQEVNKTSTASDLSATPLINTSSVESTVPEIGISDSTPMKGVTEKDDLVLETPALSTPKRPLPTCEDKEKTMTHELSDSKAGTQTAKRSLDFSKLDDEESSFNLIPHEMELTKIVPSTFGQMKGEKSNVAGQTCNQGHVRADEPTSVCLSDLILTIHNVFESVNCRSITKEELIHKIIMNNLDIDEDSNIEEQIEQLENLVPGWIHKQVTISGDMLYKISMVSDLNSVCERVISI